jgi:hypothetical protein
MFLSRWTAFHKFLTIGLLLSFSAHAELRNFETARLKSTAGAGVGSMLMDEATFLNPAPLAFFRMSSVYFQKSSGDISNSDSSPMNSNEAEQVAFVASDANENLSGSISYNKSTIDADERKQLGFAFASVVGKKSSMGVSYRTTTDRETSNGFDYDETKYKQTNFGFMHALNSEFTLGILFVDPFKSKSDDTRGIVGIQYVYDDFVSLMLDAGADYNNNLSDSFLYKAGLQLKVYNDFFLRAGTYDDKGARERGTGAGIGWIQPKLVLDFGIKNSKLLANAERGEKARDVKETAFSLSFRF